MAGSVRLVRGRVFRSLRGRNGLRKKGPGTTMRRSFKSNGDRFGSHYNEDRWLRTDVKEANLNHY